MHGNLTDDLQVSLSELTIIHASVGDAHWRFAPSREHDDDGAGNTAWELQMHGNPSDDLQGLPDVKSNRTIVQGMLWAAP
ncbi:hypothetical protein B0H11DRAFT_2214099 [Mycena galericulata]|nr:hypothetical protein B0H11DRAFT_2214099 [Mycena galericulata]